MDKNTTPNNLNIHSRKAVDDLRESGISCPVVNGFSVGNEIEIKGKVIFNVEHVKKWVVTKGTC